MSDVKKINIWVLAIALSVSTLTGCSVADVKDWVSNSDADAKKEVDITSTEAEEPEEEIELIDPVGVAAEYEIVSYQNIYNAEVIDTVISPLVKEYQYTSAEPFGSYGALPGDEISAGQVLIYGATEGLQDNIENLQDEINRKEEDYTESITSLYENRYDAVKEEYRTSCDYMDMKNDEPAEDAPWYAGWAAGVMPLESAYKNAKLARERIDNQIAEAEDLHELEAAYDQSRLAKLEGKRDQSLIVAGQEGTLVAANYYSAGDSIIKNSEVMAIGDMSVKVVYAPYISGKAYSELDDIFVMSNGKRYEVTYEPVDQNEYSRLKQKNSDVYLPFILDDPDNKLQMGDTATLVIVRAKAENVLCVPSDSVTKENGQASVYLYDENGSVSTQIEIGLVGNMYTEVLSGLSAGDKVLTKSAVGKGSKTRILEKGVSSQEFKGNGMLIYPSTEWLTNPAKYGDTYVKEILIDKNEAITAGQELITLEVIPDKTEIARLERKISRLQARLQTLLTKKSQNYSNEVDYSLEQAIRQKNTAISRYTEELNKLNAYAGDVTLSATYDGIILDVAGLKAGDHVGYKQNLLCLADTSESLLALEKTGGKLGCGKSVDVSFKNRLAETTEIQGTVVTVVDEALSKSLQTGAVLIRFDKEAAALIAEAGGSIESHGGWGRAMFTVTTQTSLINDCVLVPRSAVTVKNGDTFVRVKSDDDTVQLVQFISGGYDMQNYWVVSGLSEGMEICLD